MVNLIVKVNASLVWNYQFRPQLNIEWTVSFSAITIMQKPNAHTLE